MSVRFELEQVSAFAGIRSRVKDLPASTKMPQRAEETLCLKNILDFLAFGI
jgi:hypothetical protein